ncbi:hypothetical protein MKK68_01940 [Methylobacterium sp. E-016]|uniref:DUF7940 domain-containing protein n=1 Tax=Methylobacterium sp. E-016 TaxID=2836556 RepID=UPI001FBB0906|nr:hypothetical protein [Methylobacterium sp. E-016]MCJ2074423.1 hypothetical protein [Methylobacterium sp. E-016]
MKFEIVENARCVLRHAWSIRLILLAAALDGANTCISFFTAEPPVSRGLMSLITIGLSVSAAAARFVSQEKVSGKADADGGQA